MSEPSFPEYNSELKMKKATVPSKSISDKAPRKAIESPSRSLRASTKKTPEIIEKQTQQVPLSPHSNQHSEINDLLEELYTQPQKLHLPENRQNADPQEKSRRAIRYSFHPIKAKLEKKYLLGLNSTLNILILNISSKGAIIELKKPSKIQGKMTLTINFDSQHIFIIPSKIVRKEKKNIYALQFIDNQHQLTDFLIDSGHSFLF